MKNQSWKVTKNMLNRIIDMVIMRRSMAEDLLTKGKWTPEHTPLEIKKEAQSMIERAAKRRSK